MEKMDLETKSDRELLLLVAQRQNEIIDCLAPIRKWIYGNGVPGAKTQLYILWSALVILGGAIFIGK